MAKWHKVVLVVGGAIVLSTVAIQASDLVRGINGNMAGMAIDASNPCGAGALLVNLGTGSICADTFEAAPSPSCPRGTPKNMQDTQDNLNEGTCAVVSEKAREAWRFVSLAQAQQLCARGGKRLPTNAEWYALAVAQTDQASCVLKQSAPSLTGAANCTTAAGVQDMIGNVWEWVDGQVTEGQFDGRVLPVSGYVSVVDTSGIVVETAASPVADYGQDYAKTAPVGVFGIIRGGFYGSESDGGIFAQNLSVPLDLKTDGVGFRCVKSL